MTKIQDWIQAGVDHGDCVEREMCAGHAAYSTSGLRLANKAGPPLWTEEELEGIVLEKAQFIYGRSIMDGKMPYENRNELFKGNLQYLAEKLSANRNLAQ